MFHIVFVCSGNRCRSPLAEIHLHRLAEGLPIEVSSVGTLDIGPVPAVPELIEVARASGLDLSTHRARALSGVDLSDADLVIGLERTHVATAVVEANVPYERAFSFREVVRLLGRIEPPRASEAEEAARLAVARAHEVRKADPAFVPGEDIQDPFGGPRQGYLDMAQEIAGLSAKLLEGLVPDRATRSREPSSR